MANQISRHEEKHEFSITPKMRVSNPGYKETKTYRGGFLIKEAVNSFRMVMSVSNLKIVFSSYVHLES